MSLELPLYLHNNLNQAPGLALNIVAPYAQGIGYLKTKAAHYIFNVIYPILRHPRSSTTSAVLFSTKYMANLTGMAHLHQRICYILSRRAGRVASIENQLLLKLKKLSNYCMQLNTSYIPWQKIPELQALEKLKEELVNKQQVAPSLKLIAEAISCCDEIHALVTLYRSISSTEDLNPEEIRAIEENTDVMFSAIEENTGEALGSYTPSILAPIFNDLVNSIPESHNLFTLTSHALITTLKKISVIVGSSSLLAITSNNYFVSSNAQKTLLQLTSISGMSAIGLYCQEQVEEVAKEVLQTFFVIICSYGGMWLFKTDEPFRDYFHKIVPATALSKATEYYLDFKESSAITSFALPLLVSSLAYNQASIRESYQRFKELVILVESEEAKRQLLQPVASFITDRITNNFSNGLNLLTLHGTIEQICSSELRMLARAILWTIPHVGNQSLNHVFVPLFHPIIQQLLSQPTEQQMLQILSFSTDKSLMLLKEYLSILQQDDMQELILRIQQKLQELDPEAEELKNQFLKEVFLKKTGIPLHLNNFLLDLLKKSSALDIQASLFTSFKYTPTVIRMLWNSYSYHKKVDQTLTLELLLQGLIISGLSDLMLESNPAELSSFSYVKTASLGISLAL